jgi:anaerobic dimethyl sulfoxide reductase subunit A
MTGVPFSCNLDCGGGCPLLAFVEDGKVTKVIDNPAGGEYIKGCIRGYQSPHIQNAPDRLTKPLIRTGPRGSGEFREASWNEALDLVAEKIAEVKEKHGNEAILNLGGSGAIMSVLHNTKRLANRFLHLFGGATGRWLGYSSAANMFTLPYLLGTVQAGFDSATLKYSNLIILWGSNVVDNRFGSATESWIKDAKKRGVKVITIDPRVTNTVRTLGDQWIKVLPGTDTALMMAVLNVLIKEDLVDRSYIAKYVYGFKDLEAHILGLDDGVDKTPDWAEGMCGTPSETIRQLALEYGNAKPACLITGLAIQRVIGGEEAVRMAVSLQAATGNIGVRGGSSGGYFSSMLPSLRVGALEIMSNPVKATVPTYEWADAVIQGKKGGYPVDIKFIYVLGTNYLNQGSDIKKNKEAFSKAEFSVAHERFMTATALHCDVVFPVSTSFERTDVMKGGGNFLLYSKQVVPKLTGVKHDYEILCELAERLGFQEEFTEGKTEEEWLDHFIAESEIEDIAGFKEKGIYLGKEQERVAFTDFIVDPVKHALNTPSSKIQLYSEEFAMKGGSPIPEFRPSKPNPDYPLSLVTPKSRYRTHSQNYNIKWFSEMDPQKLWINPVDAKERTIEDGQLILISSPQGKIRIEAFVTEDIIPGVVCLLEGAWPKYEGDIEVQGSANAVTSTRPTLPSHGSRTHTVHVQIEKA